MSLPGSIRWVRPGLDWFMSKVSNLKLQSGHKIGAKTTLCECSGASPGKKTISSGSNCDLLWAHPSSRNWGLLHDRRADLDQDYHFK
jgi:hypothetical protein